MWAPQAKFYQAVFISLIFWLVPHAISNLVNIIITTLGVWLVLVGGESLTIEWLIRIFKSITFKNLKRSTLEESRRLVTKIAFSSLKSLEQSKKTLDLKSNREMSAQTLNLLAKKPKVKELKEYCRLNNIILPKEGSGKKGSLLKRDVLLAISRNTTLET